MKLFLVILVILTVRVSMATPWTLYAIEYARSKDIPVKSLALGYEGDKKVDMSWYFYLAQSGETFVLIDTGTDQFSEGKFFNWFLRYWWSIEHARSLPQALAEIHLTPNQSFTTVLTHPHWDHVDNLAYLTNTRVIVQTQTLADARTSRWTTAAVKQSFDELENKGLITRFEGYLQPLPGIVVFEKGKHTSHQVMVEVACSDRRVILANDAAYLKLNLIEDKSDPTSDDPVQNLQDLRWAKGTYGIDNVIPGHDPDVIDKYPKIAPGISRICGG